MLYVHDPLLTTAAAVGYDERTLERRSAAELDRFIGRALGIGARRRVTSHVVIGRPAREIQRAASRWSADLIVLGSHGLRGASRLFFGSTTAHLLAHAAVPVLAVPPAGLRTSARWPTGRMLAAIGLGAHARHDVAAAASLAHWMHAPLSVVHVVEPPQRPAWLSALARLASGSGPDARTSRERLQRARTQVAGLAVAVGGNSLVTVGDPAEQIAAAATGTGISLVVLTLRGSDHPFGRRQGAITYQVVCQAAVPVLALPAGWTLPTAD